MKSIKKLDDLKDLKKDSFIEEMLLDSIKGGCCGDDGPPMCAFRNGVDILIRNNNN